MSSQDAPPQHIMELFLGKQLLTDAKGTKKSTAELFKDKDFVLLYFSASWCPPCKAFSPVLIDFYKENAAAAKLEIVYVSSDRSQEDFEAYYGKMPWLAVPTDDEGRKIMDSLSSSFKIRSIPTLVVLQAKTGLFITSEAREQVQSFTRTGRAAFLVQEWKNAKAVPISELAKGIGGSPIGLLPTLFLIAYIIFWIWRFATRSPAAPDELEQVFGKGAVDEDKEF